MKKRLCIFHFYDQYGKVDFHVRYLLKEISTVAKKIVIVINGIIDDDGMLFFESYSSSIFIRKNVGYDAGGYRDVVLKMSDDELTSYDSLILCNDTFYGPFVPIIDIFEDMDSKKLDLWGLDKDERGIFSQIHSYFLVLEKEMIKRVKQFFQNKKTFFCNDTIYEAWIHFEYALSCFAKDEGLNFGSFAFGENRNIYTSPNYTVCRSGVPILKRKFFTQRYFDASRFHEIINFLKQNSNYPWEEILHEEQRKGINNWLNTVTCEKKRDDEEFHSPDVGEDDIKEFCARYKSIYVYGAGLFGQELAYRMCQMKIFIDGFLVSFKKGRNQQLAVRLPIYVFERGRFSNENIGIVVGMNYLNSKEVFGILNMENVLFLWNELNQKNFNLET